MIISFPTWYEHISDEKKFVLEFIEQVESQISSNIASYESEKEEHTEIYEDEDFYQEDTVEVYKGLNSSEYDVAGLFTSYFPNLHRRSAFITLYSFLEVELIRLCNELKKDKNLSTSYDDNRSRDSYIGKAAHYIITVAGVNWNKNVGVWSEINNIRLLRNQIAHENGKLDETEDAALITYITGSPYLKGDVGNEYLINEIIIEVGFLNYVLTKIYELFDEINTAMENP